jgi:hypothetical protein
VGQIIPAGGRFLIVNNITAFNLRHPGVPASLIAGKSDGSFNNDGEFVELLDRNDTSIQSFTYNDQLPWPTSSDGDGFSLVLVAPRTNPDHTVGSNWRSSVLNPTPGSNDATTFAGDPDADFDNDGTSALLEYAFGSSDSLAHDAILPASGTLTASNPPRDGLLFTFRRNLAADDLKYTLQHSNDLVTWSNDLGDLILWNSINNGDGTSTEQYLIADSLDQNEKSFIRILITPRE